jgi:hypothetical protein
MDVMRSNFAPVSLTPGVERRLTAPTIPSLTPVINPFAGPVARLTQRCYNHGGLLCRQMELQWQKKPYSLWTTTSGMSNS